VVCSVSALLILVRTAKAVSLTFRRNAFLAVGGQREIRYVTGVIQWKSDRVGRPLVRRFGAGGKVTPDHRPHERGSAGRTPRGRMVDLPCEVSRSAPMPDCVGWTAAKASPFTIKSIGRRVGFIVCEKKVGPQ
jgi:hypothetical protein